MKQRANEEHFHCCIPPRDDFILSYKYTVPYCRRNWGLSRASPRKTFLGKIG